MNTAMPSAACASSSTSGMRRATTIETQQRRDESAAALEQVRAEAAERWAALDDARKQTLARAERAEAQLDELLATTRAPIPQT